MGWGEFWKNLCLRVSEGGAIAVKSQRFAKHRTVIHSMPESKGPRE
jgi:hypothetical protein